MAYAIERPSKITDNEIVGYEIETFLWIFKWRKPIYKSTTYDVKYSVNPKSLVDCMDISLTNNK